jgi:hypothetical protein
MGIFNEMKNKSGSVQSIGDLSVGLRCFYRQEADFRHYSRDENRE